MTMKLNLLLLLLFIVELVAAVTNYNLGSAPVSRYSLKTGTYSPVAPPEFVMITAILSMRGVILWKV